MDAIRNRAGADAGAPTSFFERHYTAYLICVALAGWSLASYDFNLLVLTFPDISRSLHLSPTMVGLLGFIIYAAMFVITFAAGWAMDTFGRKRMWMFCLTAAAVFTGLTFFVHTYRQLAVVRALASGFAHSELAISVTLVNEQVPSARRGLFYSIVQGGWPVGVFLASGVYLFDHFGWRTVFLFGALPIIAVIVGHFWVKESDRFLRLRQVRNAAMTGDQGALDRLMTRYRVDAPAGIMGCHRQGTAMLEVWGRHSSARRCRRGRKDRCLRGAFPVAGPDAGRPLLSARR